MRHAPIIITNLFTAVIILDAVPKVKLTLNNSKHPDFRSPEHHLHVLRPSEPQRSLFVAYEVKCLVVAVPPYTSISTLELIKGFLGTILSKVSIKNIAIYLSMMMPFQLVMLTQRTVMHTNNLFVHIIKRMGVLDVDVTHCTRTSVPDKSNSITAFNL